jgi:hypothetical protein
MTSRNLNYLIAANTPVWIKNLSRPLYKHILSANFAPPVAQMYICNGHINTKLGINNFYSFLAASGSTDASVRLRFYSSGGDLIKELHRNLVHFSGIGIDVKGVFAADGLKSDYGMVTCEIIPKWPRRAIYKPLGVCASHFFTFYESARGSMGHIHPSSVLDPNNAVSSDFLSNQNISGDGLEKIVLLQLNPTNKTIDLQHVVYEFNQDELKLISSKRNSFKPFETKMIEFVAGDDFARYRDALYTIGVKPLPSSNSKPMLFRFYSNERFSVSHS